MKIITFHEYNNVYILPFVRVYYDKYLDSNKFRRFYIEIGWIKWCIGLVIK